MEYLLVMDIVLKIFAEAIDMYPLLDRANCIGLGISFHSMGGLLLLCFLARKLLLPKTKIRNILIPARPNFYTLSGTPNVSLKIVDCLLFIRRIFL